MKMDQGLAWMLALLLASIGGSGFYWWATQSSGSKYEAMIASGTEPSPSPSASTAPVDEGHATEGTGTEGTGTEGNGKINAALPASWAYQGSTGPKFWARLDPDYLECGSVKGQSPVDLDNTRLDPKLKPIAFHYRQANLTTTLRGQELLATVSDGNYVEIEGDRYNLNSISIHTPSEHQLQSVPYEMEIQLNHRSASGDLAVIGIFVAAGSRNEDIELLLASLPRGDGDRRELAGFELMRLIPKKRTYFHYKGSLTAPPCTGNVQWYMFTTAIEAATRDIEKAVRLVINNSRPLQRAAGRSITRSNR
jgi:carbonic anhydrase